jgi:hypothetical protein
VVFFERQKIVLMRKLIIITGLVLLIIGAVGIWRQLHPPLTDEQQIAGNIEDIARAASEKRLGGILTYLDKGFKYGGMGKKDIQTSLAGAFWSYRKVDAQISGVRISIVGEWATSTGHYAIAIQRETDLAPETFSGDFKVKWKKINGEWKAMEGEGGQLPSF